MNVSGPTFPLTPALPMRQNSAGNSSPSEPQSSSATSAGNAQGLTPEQLKTLSELKARDREVRAHEAAHQAVGGQYTGAISFVYERGPDGAQYAVGGEVSIDTSPVAGDPDATIDKMRTVRAAALAPAEPSAQDRAVAAEAMQIMLQAQAELATESSSSGGTSLSGRDAAQTYGAIASLASTESGPSSITLQTLA